MKLISYVQNYWIRLSLIKDIDFSAGYQDTTGFIIDKYIIKNTAEEINIKEKESWKRQNI